MLGPARREGFHTVTPYVMVVEPEPLVAFLEAAFGGEVTYRTRGSGGGHHIEVQVGDSRLMIGGGQGSVQADQPAAFFLYVDDVDAVHDAAVAAGATSIMAPADGRFEEERGAGVVGPGGTRWFLGRHGSASTSPG